MVATKNCLIRDDERDLQANDHEGKKGLSDAGWRGDVWLAFVPYQQSPNRLPELETNKQKLPRSLKERQAKMTTAGTGGDGTRRTSKRDEAGERKQTGPTRILEERAQLRGEQTSKTRVEIFEGAPQQASVRHLWPSAGLRNNPQSLPHHRQGRSGVVAWD